MTSAAHSWVRSAGIVSTTLWLAGDNGSCRSRVAKPTGPPAVSVGQFTCTPGKRPLANRCANCMRLTSPLLDTHSAPVLAYPVGGSLPYNGSPMAAMIWVSTMGLVTSALTPRRAETTISSGDLILSRDSAACQNSG